MERMAIDSLFCFVAETKSRRETIFKQLEDIDRSTKIAKKKQEAQDGTYKKV